VLSKHAVDGSPGSAIALGQLSQAETALAILEDRFSIKNQWLAPDLPPFEPSTAHAGPDPLDDQVTFQLGDSADDDHDRPAQRTAGVDLLSEADELDVDPIQLVEDFQKMPHRTCDPIASPDQDNVELPAARIPHQIVEARPAGFNPADPVRVFSNDLEAALSGHLTQVMDLRLRVLIDG
jgi:hypothetical protein